MKFDPVVRGEAIYDRYKGVQGQSHTPMGESKLKVHDSC
jgi:hypothetical protein